MECPPGTCGVKMHILKSRKISLNTARQHAWSCWQKENVRGLMESHRINRDISCLPEVGKIVLVVRQEKNKGELKKAKVLRLVKGKDNVVRDVIHYHDAQRKSD